MLNIFKTFKVSYSHILKVSAAQKLVDLMYSFWLKIHKNRLAARLCPDLWGEGSALPQT